MNLRRLDVPAVHRARPLGELVSDPAGILEQLSLHCREPLERTFPGLARHLRSHWRLGDICRMACWALDQSAGPLFLEIRSRSEPGFEPLAAVEAQEVEHHHWCTTCGIGR